MLCHVVFPLALHVWTPGDNGHPRRAGGPFDPLSVRLALSGGISLTDVLSSVHSRYGSPAAATRNIRTAKQNSQDEAGSCLKTKKYTDDSRFPLEKRTEKRWNINTAVGRIRTPTGEITTCLLQVFFSCAFWLNFQRNLVRWRDTVGKHSSGQGKCILWRIWRHSVAASNEQFLSNFTYQIEDGCVSHFVHMHYMFEVTRTG